MKTATNAALHPAASMMNSVRVILAWPRGRSWTRWLRISAPSEASRKSDADIAKEDRLMLTPGLNRRGQMLLHFGTAGGGPKSAVDCQFGLPVPGVLAGVWLFGQRTSTCRPARRRSPSPRRGFAFQETKAKNLWTFVGRFSFDLSASLSLPSFSWLSPSWALSLGISWLTFWLSYRPCSSA